MLAAVTPAPNEGPTIEEIADPTPRSGEVLVRVRAASVNRLDVATWKGLGFRGEASFPLVQGLDAAGVVEAGSGSIPTGTRVVVKPTIPCLRCRWCRAKMAEDCDSATWFGIHRQGGYAELLAVPRQSLAVLPDSIPFPEAAAAAHVHPVVLRMIRAAGPLPPEPTMLVTGATGALGGAAVQLGAALGHRVVAVASTTEKMEHAAANGADVVVHRTALGTESMAEALDGVGADLVIETTGAGDVIADAHAALARRGRMVLVAAFPGASLELDVLATYRTRTGVIGSSGSSHRDFADAFALIDEHGIVPTVAARFPLEQVPAAMAAVGERERIGKVVVEVP